jgi:hypothetical protein
MDYSESPLPWDPSSDARTPAQVAAAFAGPCYALSAPAGGRITGAGWAVDGGTLREVHIHHDLPHGGSAVVVTTRDTGDLQALMANVYASHIDIDGPSRDRMDRARAMRTAPVSACTFTIDGTPEQGRLVADHAAVILGCALPDRTVIAFLTGNPLPRPTTFTRLHSQRDR